MSLNVGFGTATPQLRGYKGCSKLGLASTRYSQQNNILENYLLDLRNNGTLDQTHLVSCNVEALACAIESVGANWRVTLPNIDGKSFFGQGDLMSFYLNSPKVKPTLPVNNPKYPENEFIDNLNHIVDKFSDAKSSLHKGPNSMLINGFKEYFLDSELNSCEVLSVQLPGGGSHFITVTGYNPESDKFLYMDPSNVDYIKCNIEINAGKKGCNMIITSEDLERIMRPRSIHIYK